MRLIVTYFVYTDIEVMLIMSNKTVKKTKEEHAAGVREHSKKYGFPVKQKDCNEKKSKRSGA